MCLLYLTGGEKLGLEERKKVLMEIIDKSGDEELRRAAAESLNKVEGKMSLPLVIDNLRHGDKVIRLQAIYSLGKIGGEKAINALYSLWSVDSDVDERAAAARALSEIDDPRSMKFFWKVFQLEKEKVVKVELFQLLKKWKDRRGTGILLKELSSRDADYLIELIRVLGKLGDPRVEPYLIKLAGSRHRGIKMAAVEALGELDA